MTKCGFNAAMQKGGKKTRTNKHKGGGWFDSSSTDTTSQQLSVSAQPQINQSYQSPLTQTSQPQPQIQSQVVNEGFFSRMLKKIGIGSQSGGKRYKSKSRKNRRKTHKRGKSKQKTRSRR